MSKIDNFLDWMVDTSTKDGKEFNPWKTPFIRVASIGFLLVFVGCIFNITPLTILGALTFIMVIISALNWECKVLGRYKFLRKKIF